MHKAFDNDEPPWSKQELGFRNKTGNPHNSTTKMTLPKAIDTFQGQDNAFHHDAQLLVGCEVAGSPPSAISSGS
jgi:hypothetical protein